MNFSVKPDRLKVSLWPSPSKIPWNESVVLLPTGVDTLMSLVSFT